MDNKARFAADTVQNLQKWLDDVPPYAATEYSKQQAIEALVPQILRLRSKGYSWTAVATMLSERGVPVSAAALRTYLRRARDEATDAPARSRIKRSSAPRHPSTAVASPSPPPPATAPATATTRFSPPGNSGTASPQRVQPARSESSAYGTFTVRPDTKDL